MVDEKVNTEEDATDHINGLFVGHTLVRGPRRTITLRSVAVIGVQPAD
jgi:hypothetical protein